MTINVPDLIAIFLTGFGVLLCIGVGLRLFFRKEGSRQTRLLLAVLLVLYGVNLLNSFLAMIGLYAQYQFLYFLPLSYSLWVGPLFYFFVRSRVEPSFRLSWKHGIHFLFPVIQALFYFAIGFRSAAFKSWVWQEIVGPYTQYVEEGLGFLLNVGYVISALVFLRRKVPQSAWKRPVYRWLRRFAWSLLSLLTIISFYDIIDWILYGWYEYNLFNSLWLDFPLKMAMAGISFLIGYNAYVYQHQELLLPKPAAEPAPNKNLALQLDRLIQEEQVYLDPEMNLETLANLLGVHKNDLSRLLSTRGTTFRGLLNTHRVSAFIEKVESGEYAHLSLLGIAFEAGFNSKSSFNRIFKEIKGQSPTAYFAK